MSAIPQPEETDDPHLVARAFVEAEEEMPAALAWAGRNGVDLRYDRETLTASTKISGPAADGADGDTDEDYLIVASFDSYRLLPPVWKLVHPETGEEIGLAACPKPQGDSVFHPQGLICAHWSRLAYSEHGGPHSDWGGQTTWQHPAGNYTVALTIPDMLDRLAREVRASRGRMAELPR